LSSGERRGQNDNVPSSSRAVLIAGGPLPPEKQSAFLERVAGHLRLVGYNRVSDADVERTIRAAMAGLLQEPAA
jgi:hypothetical protein